VSTFAKGHVSLVSFMTYFPLQDVEAIREENAFIAVRAFIEGRAFISQKAFIE